MPIWLLRLWPHGLALLALIGALWWIDQRGYSRAMAERDVRDARLLTALRQELRHSEAALASAIARSARDYADLRATLDRESAALQPMIIREIARENRLADPAAGLTPGLLDAVNRARAAGACAAGPPGRTACALPIPPADR